jgi:molybdopterin synthase catalytic subunit
MHHLFSPLPLSVTAACDAVSGHDAGAVVTFVGTVRDRTRGRAVVRLEYEAYEAMGLRLFAAIAGEARRFGEARVAIHHRVGRCQPGEVSVVVAAAAAHRAEAFEACRHAVERLKADAPVWKKEFFEDGAVWVGQGS